MTTKKQVLFFVLVLFSLRAIARGEDTSIGRDVAKAYAEGKSPVDKGDFALAISSFSEAVRLDPKFALAYHGRGVAYWWKGEYDKAIADYSEAIRLNPKDAEAYYGRGVANGSKRDNEKQIADYNEAIQLNPVYAEAYNGRGIAYGKKGEYDKAIADYNEAIRLDQRYAEAYCNRGSAYGSRGEYDRAITDCTQAVRLNPKLAAAYCGRGVHYSSKGDYDKAIADLTEAIRLDPKYSTSHYNRGVAYAKKGEQDKAVHDYTEAIRLDPKDPDAYFDRGVAYAQKDERGKAICDFDAAVRLSPERPSYYEGRAATRIGRGDYEGGIADLQTALRLDPNDAAAKFETSPKEPLTAAAIQHGEQQVRQMLRDRPAMALFGEKAGVLYQWAARKFAGEDLHEELLWDGSEPVSFDADSQPPTKGGPGRIRIRRTYSDGLDKGKEQSFESMWMDAVFELYNIANAQDFQRLDTDVAEGQLTKAAFVTKKIECESRAAEKTRAFYIHVLLPWAKEQHAPTDPKLWYVACPSGSRERPLLLRVDKRGAYWKNYEHLYDSILLNSLLSKGENEKAISLAAKMQKEVTTREEIAVIYIYRGYCLREQGRTRQGHRRLQARPSASARRMPRRITTGETPMGTRATRTGPSPTITRPSGSARSMRWRTTFAVSLTEARVNSRRGLPTTMRPFGSTRSTPTRTLAAVRPTRTGGTTKRPLPTTRRPSGWTRKIPTRISVGAASIGKMASTTRPLPTTVRSFS